MENKQELQINTEAKELPREVRRRELIDRATRRGIYKYRQDHVILDCGQMKKETLLDGCEESSILVTEEEGGLLSANSLLSLIGR